MTRCAGKHGLANRYVSSPASHNPASATRSVRASWQGLRDHFCRSTPDQSSRYRKTVGRCNACLSGEVGGALSHMGICEAPAGRRWRGCAWGKTHGLMREFCLQRVVVCGIFVAYVIRGVLVRLCEHYFGILQKCGCRATGLVAGGEFVMSCGGGCEAVTCVFCW